MSVQRPLSSQQNFSGTLPPLSACLSPKGGGGVAALQEDGFLPCYPESETAGRGSRSIGRHRFAAPSRLCRLQIRSYT